MAVYAQTMGLDKVAALFTQRRLCYYAVRRCLWAYSYRRGLALYLLQAQYVAICTPEKERLIVALSRLLVPLVGWRLWALFCHSLLRATPRNFEDSDDYCYMWVATKILCGSDLLFFFLKRLFMVFKNFFHSHHCSKHFHRWRNSFFNRPSATTTKTTNIFAEFDKIQTSSQRNFLSNRYVG